jgi:hypothetical protein
VISSDDVLAALRLWHGGDTPYWPLAKMRLGLGLAQADDVYSTLAEAGPAANNRAILSYGLEQLRSASPEAEELLKERFENRRDVLTVANRLNISESTLILSAATGCITSHRSIESARGRSEQRMAGENERPPQHSRLTKR